MDIFVDYFPESIGDPYSSFFISESQNLSIVVVASSQDGFRSFAGGVSFVDGQYQEIICGTSVPSQEINPPELNNNQLTCGEGSVEINP
ncbi:MAG: hypothetical protein EA365_16060 [Gloeocapsa sp. DLM2.Bin57]|nr:MAG: hypothetical protein EA365_16060 [Gloeocapsa sp. DLM2.Bin57]